MMGRSDATDGLWFYFSFADGSRPKGTQFLGGVYIQVPPEAEGLNDKAMLWETLRKSHRIGVNPGGEVKTIGPIPAAVIEANVPAASRERLLTEKEINP